MKKFEQSKDGLKTFPLANKIKIWLTIGQTTRKYYRTRLAVIYIMMLPYMEMFLF